MPFEPFGYSFELQSLSAPSHVKAAIRSRKKGWFDTETGARGWIVGPFICLWFSALDRYGPMLFGCISRDDHGTRISGRAGSDLNGLLLYSVLLPVLAVALYQMISSGDYAIIQVLVAGGVLLASPLVFWWSHKERRDAEPLVRFLRDTITTSGQSLRTKAAAVALPSAFTLNVSGKLHQGPLTSEVVHDALLRSGPKDFVILAEGEERYIQTASCDGGFVLEKRDGDGQRHFQAVRNALGPTPQQGSNSVFSFEEAREVLLAHTFGATTPLFVVWERMHDT